MTGKILPEQVIAGEWPRSNREVIRVTLGTFQGRPVFSIRAWYRLPDGNFRPGPDGVTLSAKHLAPMADAVCEAYRLACQLGFIEPDNDNAAS